ncbi:hypothetical protein GUJ93_ZPchr0012g20927 [Zizania palustris]|uniref:Uncharacterized protein n=1 Tax=Zizania palustris TaxID=103762 RepID=A0A8J6BWC2_ZIZPA|nr:hypothetical protein GUJ93_ZPchr0012g20927 [Zizania palustris]
MTPPPLVSLSASRFEGAEERGGEGGRRGVVGRQRRLADGGAGDRQGGVGRVGQSLGQVHHDRYRRRLKAIGKPPILPGVLELVGIGYTRFR